MDQARDKIGFIGLGRMGCGMASNIRRKQFPLTVHDIAPGPVAALEALGAASVGSAAAVAAHFGPRLLDGWLVDEQDKEAVDDPRLAGIEVRALPLYMRDPASTSEIARTAIELAAELRS